MFAVFYVKSSCVYALFARVCACTKCHVYHVFRPLLQCVHFLCARLRGDGAFLFLHHPSIQSKSLDWMRDPKQCPLHSGILNASPRLALKSNDCTKKFQMKTAICEICWLNLHQPVVLNRSGKKLLVSSFSRERTNSIICSIHKNRGSGLVWSRCRHRSAQHQIAHKNPKSHKNWLKLTQDCLRP